jgi:manganese/iron transport system permease protein
LILENLWWFLSYPVENYAFMQRALVTSILVGVICAVLSSFIVLKGWSLIGDAISHSVLPGLVVAYMLGFPLFLGAFVAGVLASVGITFLERNSPVKRDAGIGIVFTGMFALGIAMLPIAIDYVAKHGVHERHVDVMHILFGNVLGVTNEDMLITAGTGVLLLLVVAAFYKELLLYSFDPVQARVLGIPTGFLHYTLMVLTAAAVVASLSTVGIVLVIALLITPGATAFLLTDRLPSMMVVASLVSVGASVAGMYVSFYWNLASGAVIVLFVTLAFFGALLLSPRRGILTAKLRRRAARAGDESTA